MRRSMRGMATVGAVAIGAIIVTGCSEQDTSALGQIQPGQVVYADLWMESGDDGDQAQVEQKPSNLWVIDTSASFRTTQGGEFDVKVRLNPDTGVFEVLDMGKTKVGRDHDNCLSLGDTEHYAVLLDKTVTFEKDAGPGDGANDDCVVQPEGSH